MKPRICVPLPVERLSDLASMIRKAENLGADLIEIRLDYLQEDILSQLDGVGKIISQVAVPLIATNREYSQGGKRYQEEEQRMDIRPSADEQRPKKIISHTNSKYSQKKQDNPLQKSPLKH